MNVELQINNSISPDARFVSWSPSPCRIRVTNPSGVTAATVNLTITGVSAASGGAVVFRSGTTGSIFQQPDAVGPDQRHVRAVFRRRQVRAAERQQRRRHDRSPRRQPHWSARLQVMVRIRKNANALTAGERDRFVSAFAQLNNQGLGRFADFRDMHTDVSLLQKPMVRRVFCPWHRAYLLDLERELQAIDPSVALPYWRFDQPAPNLFTARLPRRLRFARHRPVSATPTRCSSGRPMACRGSTAGPCCFNTAVCAARSATEAQTLALGTQYPGVPDHGRQSARTRRTRSFGGSISSIDTAAKDPLFFLLHCNVDRLWAKWQRQNGRFNPAQAASYDSNPGKPIGHKLARHDVAVERDHRRSTSSDGARRRDGRVALCQRAGTAAARAQYAWTTRAPSTPRRGWDSTTTTSQF